VRWNDAQDLGWQLGGYQLKSLMERGVRVLGVG
jgi:hypothetical protein